MSDAAIYVFAVQDSAGNRSISGAGDLLSGRSWRAPAAASDTLNTLS